MNFYLPLAYKNKSKTLLSQHYTRCASYLHPMQWHRPPDLSTNTSLPQKPQLIYHWKLWSKSTTSQQD